MSALIQARFRERPNRFVVRAELESGATVDCHLADPGRLRELLLPGVELRLRESASTKRRTRYTVALVRSGEPPRNWVGVEPVRANDLATELIREGRLPGVSASGPLDREVRHGKSRFDFLATDEAGERIWVEVKSVTLVEAGVGLFPDAPTARGARHLAELTSRVREGEAAMVLFVVQRGDATSVVPHEAIDPKFAAAFEEATRAGVRACAARFRVGASGSADYEGMLPVRTGLRRHPLPARAETTSAAARPGSGRRRSS